MRTIAIAAALAAVTAPAQGAWNQLRCQNHDDAAFLQLTVEAGGKVHVETETTQRFLLGLTCRIPLENEPLFRCTAPGDSDITFASHWVTERGFPHDSYGEFVERERLEIRLDYDYKNARGEQKHVARTWKFARGECQGSNP